MAVVEVCLNQMSGCFVSEMVLASNVVLELSARWC